MKLFITLSVSILLYGCTPDAVNLYSDESVLIDSLEYSLDSLVFEVEKLENSLDIKESHIVNLIGKISGHKLKDVKRYLKKDEPVLSNQFDTMPVVLIQRLEIEKKRVQVLKDTVRHLKNFLELRKRAYQSLSKTHNDLKKVVLTSTDFKIAGMQIVGKNRKGKKAKKPEDIIALGVTFFSPDDKKVIPSIYGVELVVNNCELTNLVRHRYSADYDGRSKKYQFTINIKKGFFTSSKFLLNVKVSGKQTINEIYDLQ